ncbi:hypothetical protein [Streptomyces boluensis]|uniref:Uncharacterized protein n=1 Tax=Streptomyces boluensis TaxID=1775135 RepID=A0A964USJ2_9ACTN|nr:hypothetical protein [Streptomyces boluensis]NBE54648.1 hypothetical protein [Streptomyces boluensis]
MTPRETPRDPWTGDRSADGTADPLMVAITGEEAPENLRDDPAYRAAVTDVALLREQLHGLGDALAQQPPEPEPTPVSPVRRRRTALLALAASCAAALLGGTFWLSASGGIGTPDSQEASKSTVGDEVPGGEQEPGGDPEPGGDQESGGDSGSLSPEGTVACARLIVEGTVARVDALPGATEERITLDVSRSYKPAGGERRVSFPMDVGAHPRLRPGDRALVLVSRDSARPTHWTTGAGIPAERAWIERALPGARGLTCESGTAAPTDG